MQPKFPAESALDSYMLRCSSTIGVLIGALTMSEACRPARTRPAIDILAEESAWVNAPLSPRIQFVEEIPSRSVQLLILDAHTVAPVDRAEANLGSNKSSVVRDQFGHALIRRAVPGRQLLSVSRLTFQAWSDSVTVPESAGLVVVVQLRHAHTALYNPADVRRPP